MTGEPAPALLRAGGDSAERVATAAALFTCGISTTFAMVDPTESQTLGSLIPFWIISSSRLLASGVVPLVSTSLATAKVTA